MGGSLHQNSKNKPLLRLECAAICLMQSPLSLKQIYTVQLVHLLTQYNTLYIVPGDGDKPLWRCSFYGKLDKIGISE